MTPAPSPAAETRLDLARIAALLARLNRQADRLLSTLHKDR